jgi:hypothetical protein
MFNDDKWKGFRGGSGTDWHKSYYRIIKLLVPKSKCEEVGYAVFCVIRKKNHAAENSCVYKIYMSQILK